MSRVTTSTSFARSPDGTRIAYDRVGAGDPLVLLHGGFVHDRRSWWTAGYVDRLQASFRLLVVDLRGHGESDRPRTVEAYAAEALCADVAAVLDAEGVRRAHVWGFSFGAGVALQLARSRERVDRVALGGAVLGRWLTDDAARKTADGMQLLAAAKQAGTLEQLAIPEAQKDFARKADLAAAAAIYRAMASWPVIEPEALACPAFFYAGSENALGAGSLRAYADRLRRANAEAEILEGLDHPAEFDAVDRSFPRCLAFLRRSAA
jgi:pimeloyl-ACP methyl ester carboxylesterase